MSGINRAGQRYLSNYGANYRELERAAEIAGETIKRIAYDTGKLIHVVTARAKTPESVRGKLRRKRYRNPSRQVTDTVGVRVITYYRDAVDPIVARLQQEFEIDKRRSTDKRLALGLSQFGYRSVHLIARFRPDKLLRDLESLKGRWFEIQVRSILEHAWAVIEHEIVYKSGILQPELILRRFAALAGSLELLDGEFLALREERNALIGHYRAKYERKEEFSRVFEVARLLGFLEASRPQGLSWRDAEAQGQAFGQGLDVSCVEAMRTTGLGTASSLVQMFRSQRFRYALRTFAAAQGIATQDVSHLASVVLAVAVKRPRFVQQHFPEMIYDPTIESIIARRVRI